MDGNLFTKRLLPLNASATSLLTILHLKLRYGSDAIGLMISRSALLCKTSKQTTPILGLHRQNRFMTQKLGSDQTHEISVTKTGILKKDSGLSMRCWPWIQLIYHLQITSLRRSRKKYLCPIPTTLAWILSVKSSVPQVRHNKSWRRKASVKFQYEEKALSLEFSTQMNAMTSPYTF